MPAPPDDPTQPEPFDLRPNGSALTRQLRVHLVALGASVGLSRLLRGYEGWVEGGRWSLPSVGGTARMYVFSVHTPTGRGSYEKETLTILAVLRDLVPPGSEVLIGGDFNLKSFGKRTQGQALASTSVEPQVLDSGADMGLVSCWPAAHPYRKPCAGREIELDRSTATPFSSLSRGAK